MSPCHTEASLLELEHGQLLQSLNSSTILTPVCPYPQQVTWHSLQFSAPVWSKPSISLHCFCPLVFASPTFFFWPLILTQDHQTLLLVCHSQCGQANKISHSESWCGKITLMVSWLQVVKGCFWAKMNTGSHRNRKIVERSITVVGIITVAEVVALKEGIIKE